MNLSERLDAARRQRETGEAPPVRPSIRAAVDGRTYDGTDLQTGEEIDSEGWRQRMRDRHGEFHLFGDTLIEPEDRSEGNSDAPNWVLDLRGPYPIIELED